MRKFNFIIILIFLSILVLVLYPDIYNTGQNKSLKDLDQKQEEISKPEPKQKNEKIIKQEPPQDFTSFQNAIDIYQDTINLLKWIIGGIITLLIGFGIFIWLRYKSFERKTRVEISEFQKTAKVESEDLKSRIKEETRKFETTGKMFSGIAQINLGKRQEAIPYLEGALKDREVLTDEQLLMCFFALGNIYCDLGIVPPAKYYSTEAINLNPNISLTHILMSRTLELEQDFKGALEEIKIAERIAIGENAPIDVLSRIYISYGNLHTQIGSFDEAKKIFTDAKKKIEEAMLRIPMESPQWFTLNQIKMEIENGIKYLRMRELLQEKFELEPSKKDINEALTWMKILPFAYTVEQVKQIFEDKEFIKLLKEVFDEIIQRPPLTWEILRFGDKWLAKRQEGKELQEIIKEELEKYPEFIQKKEREEEYKKLLE